MVLERGFLSWLPQIWAQSKALTLALSVLRMGKGTARCLATLARDPSWLEGEAEEWQGALQSPEQCSQGLTVGRGPESGALRPLPGVYRGLSLCSSPMGAICPGLLPPRN